MRLIIVLLSLILYAFSPNKYDYPYLLLIFALFVFSGFISIKDQIKTKEFISFNVLFVTSFFLTSFAYPIFIKPIGIDIWLSNIINENVITKSTALCQIAFSSYLLGLGIKKNKKKNYAHIITKADPINYFISPLIGFIFFIIGFFIVISTKGTINFDQGWSAFLFSFFTIYTIVVVGYSGKQSLLYKKKYYLLICIAIASFLLLFIIGDRGLILSIFVALFSAYTIYIRKIKFRYFFLLGVISVFILSFIADIRQGDSVIKNIQSYEVTQPDSKWDYFSDLTAISRNIYVGYEYKENYGFYKPERIILLSLTPIPLLPTLISNHLLGEEYSSYSSSSKIITSHSSFIKEGPSLMGGLGTHAVIDVYISWGIIGTILLFLILGHVVNISYLNIHNNIYYAMIYFVLTAFSIYIPRSTIYEQYRLIVWILALTFLFRNLTFIKSKL